MHLVSLVVSDFRNIEAATIEPDPEGTTVITGLNGSGKTSLLEATAYLSTLQSFRGSPKEAMVRRGATESILRAQTVVEGRAMTIEAELSATGRSRTLVNRQSSATARRVAPGSAYNGVLARRHRHGALRPGGEAAIPG